MSTKAHYNDQDFNKQQILNAKWHPITTANRTTLAGSLLAGDAGLIVYDTDLNVVYSWTGTAWKAQGAISVTGAVTLKGVVPFSQATPSSPASGDQYIFSTGGSNTWTGSGVTVEIGDEVIYDGSAWHYIQSNTDVATASVMGLIQLATQAEVTAGSVTNKAVTPQTLAGYFTAKTTPKVYFGTISSLVGGTPATITHNLGLQSANAFVASAKDSSGNEIDLLFTGSTVNALVVASNTTIANATFTIIGF